MEYYTIWIKLFYHPIGVIAEFYTGFEYICPFPYGKNWCPIKCHLRLIK